MRRPRKKHYNERAQYHPPLLSQQNQNSQKLDVWLSRLSHLSQFGLFALTIGALYFTVIPLYKTAALEESIARREFELTATTEKLEVATAALEKVKLEAYERDRRDLQKRIVFAAPYCSGLMTPPEAYLGENILKVDTAQCFLAEFEKSDAEKILKPEDYTYIKHVADDISHTLSLLQKQAMLDVDSVPERAAKDPSILVPMGPLEQEAEEFSKTMEKLAPGVIKHSDKLQAAIARTRNKIALNFSDAVRKEIIKIFDLDWPKKQITGLN
ncbi:hypothetical protein FBY06_11496 [Pseudomonas sp. SJZ085]|uniref:hypothetical protein n=1 Tax=unclassified Pseudomonas TaxID=196821 RepID=UPI00119BE8B1|nr:MULTISPECIES: hypothetical protein [unclassified Pseudomonas]TWC18640.1 hypothetical protein FBX99_11496 [Pseudomonas sp. SJZ074]TWC36423.1 hypothetical protein FBY06_11496 [Pseudomonas sp. SJZ085]